MEGRRFLPPSCQPKRMTADGCYYY
jgi:hypothetical protein